MTMMPYPEEDEELARREALSRLISESTPPADDVGTEGRAVDNGLAQRLKGLLAQTQAAKSQPEVTVTTNRIAADTMPAAAPARAPMDTGLADAMDEARKRRMATGIYRGLAGAAGAISGVGPDKEGLAGLEAGADSPVRDYMMRKMDAEKKAAAARDAAMRDPNSPESTRFRKAVGNAMPSIYGPDDLPFITAADKDLLFKGAEMQTELAKRRAEAQAKETEKTQEHKWKLEDTASQHAWQDKRDARARADKEEEHTDKNNERTLKTEGDLRHELLGLPATKAFQDVAVSWDKIKRAAKSGSAAGDMGMIYSLMKMYDPGSSVREGEFANAQNAGGIPDRIISQYNRIISGQRLTPEMRDDFLRAAQDLYASHEAQYRQIAGQYGGLASKYGVNPENVTSIMGPGTQGGAAQAAMVKMVAPDGTVRMVPKERVQSALMAGGRMAE